jgi:hypothetical protein
VRLVWNRKALAQLERLSKRAPGQALAVYDAMRWMADLGVSLGRPVPRHNERYWPVPPQGVLYRVSKDGGDLIVVAIRDARRRRRPFTP